ncbi:hypothetical protein M885DRAFT_522469 [Pelagophyceae sp. CCMP2097]|nr:hypothetical protein M885DRAFT_522469 [Pelagophyceae sp. CCMP2097]
MSDLISSVVNRLLYLLGSRDAPEASAIPALSQKSGYLFRVDSSGKWVKRWFELREEVLATYKADDLTKLKNAISVTKISKIALSPEEDMSHFVMTCGSTDYQFRAESPEDAAAWVKVIAQRTAAKV